MFYILLGFGILVGLILNVSIISFPLGILLSLALQLCNIHIKNKLYLFLIFLPINYLLLFQILPFIECNYIDPLIMLQAFCEDQNSFVSIPIVVASAYGALSMVFAYYFIFYILYSQTIQRKEKKEITLTPFGYPFLLTSARIDA